MSANIITLSQSINDSSVGGASNILPKLPAPPPPAAPKIKAQVKKEQEKKE